MTLFFYRLRYEMKKLKLHFPVCPDPRVKWGAADKTKHGLYFIFLAEIFFFVDDVFSGLRTVQLSTNAFFPFVYS